MIVIVSGLTGSGKTTIAKRLASKLGFEYLSGSSMLRKILPAKFDVWESKSGIDVIKLRESVLSYDKKVDSYIKNYVRTHDNLVLDSWTAAFYVKRNAVKIRLNADEAIRAKRISIRDSISLKEAKKRIHQKDLLTSRIYQKLYNIDVSKDTSPFDLIVSTNRVDANTVFNVCISFLSGWSKG